MEKEQRGFRIDSGGEVVMILQPARSCDILVKRRIHISLGRGESG